jgi:hypothetical protein
MTKARDIADLGDSIINDANNNVALGDGALDDASLSGSNNVAIGEDALQATTTPSDNTAVGYQSGYSNTTGAGNTYVGRGSGFTNTTGSDNTSVGYLSLASNTSSSYNTALGFKSAYSSTTANRLTTVGYLAGTALTTGSGNVVVGDHAFKSATTPDNSVAIGTYALANTTTGIRNTCVGSAAGEQITTGSYNTILGRFNGNQGGLDIRTSSNNIVLSDGDGNIAQWYDNSATSGTTTWGATISSGLAVQTTQTGVQITGNGRIFMATDDHSDFNKFNSGELFRFRRNTAQVGSISVSSSSTSYNTSSDHRLKENVVELTGATDRLKQLEPKRFNFIADADTTVDGFLAHEVQSVVPEAITGTHNEVDADGNPVYQGIDQAKLVPLLVATIKELEARITALEAN